MNRRRFLSLTAAISALSAGCLRRSATGHVADSWHRVRATDPQWPSPAAWQQLRRSVGGRLTRVESPFACRSTADCVAAGQSLQNPFFLGDHAALTQSSGYADAWTTAPSVYAVAAQRTADVVAAVNFARRHRLRLVVRGGGHSYHGNSNAADSLLLWTRGMRDIQVHAEFASSGCGRAAQPAVSIEAGALWLHAYGAVTTRAGRYVQGGGCTTVGVAGLVQSGGFGSFSKRYGLAAAGLLEAEVVTADGVVRTVSPCANPDLFWAVRGGGGGTFGVVTRVTLGTRELPATFGALSAAVKARSDGAFRRLISGFLRFSRERLVSPDWGEQVRFGSNNSLDVSMMFAGLDRTQAEAVWQPFFSFVATDSELAVEAPLAVLTAPAQHFWDSTYLQQYHRDAIVVDDRLGAEAGNFFWAATRHEAGQFLHAYSSVWLPATLLEDNRRDSLTEALFSASRSFALSLHFNKGLAGAPPSEIAAASETAINPAALDAFALAIIGAESAPSFPGLAGHEPNVVLARRDAAAVRQAMTALRHVVDAPASYYAESDFFESDWQSKHWGANYPRLLAIKRRYDPDGLFFAHHGVGSENWSPDGFTRIARV